MTRGAALLLAAVAAIATGCGAEEARVPAGKDPVPGRAGAGKTPAAERAARRLFDGAPPVIPHPDFGMACGACHNDQGVSVPGVGFAPPVPHGATGGMSAMSRCVQCHVWRKADGEFRGSGFEGLRQDMRRGARLYPGAPPVLPHPLQMRENCLSCHDGPAAREPIRTPHPDRVRCLQCHVPVQAPGDFERKP